MKIKSIIYWAATGLVSAGMAFSSYLYLSENSGLMQSFAQIGFPMYLVILLGIAKLLGAIALAVPVKHVLKEWAYAGFAFMFIGAVWVHVSTATPAAAPLIMLAVLAVSYYTQPVWKTKEKKAASAQPLPA